MNGRTDKMSCKKDFAPKNETNLQQVIHLNNTPEQICIYWMINKTQIIRYRWIFYCFLIAN